MGLKTTVVTPFHKAVKGSPFLCKSCMVGISCHKKAFFSQNTILSSVEIYTPSTNSWREGPPLPRPTEWAAYLPRGGSFLVAGGTDGEEFFDEVVGFEFYYWSMWEINDFFRRFWSSLPRAGASWRGRRCRGGSSPPGRHTSAQSTVREENAV